MLEFLILKKAAVSPIAGNKITNKTIQQLVAMNYICVIGRANGENVPLYFATEEGKKRLEKLGDNQKNLIVPIVSSIISAVVAFILGRFF